LAAYGEGWQSVHQVFSADNKFEILPEVKISFEGVQKIPIAGEWKLEK
jgi:hypothetical protein